MTQADFPFVRDRVPAYAGLADPAARRSSDQHLRAWAGELLAELREKRPPPDALRERLDDAILRCEFADQRLVRADEQHALDRPEAVARRGAADRAVVESVEAVVAAGADPARLAPALEAFHKALDDRTAAALSLREG